MKREAFRQRNIRVLLFREHAALLLKIFLFLLGFAVLMAGEYFVVSRHYHQLTVSELGKALSTSTPAKAQFAALSANRPVQPQNGVVPYLLKDAFERMQRNDLDSALDKVNLAIQADPKNARAYELRGDIYADKKVFDESVKNFQIVLRLDDKNARVKFNLADVQFMQKKYDVARAGFVALGKDPDMGDFANYKTFLCDLFGGHEAVAAKELDAFNQVAENASYYFANAAWSLYYHKPDDARGWLNSATHIYEPEKVRVYCISLTELGYLPLPLLAPKL